MWIVAQGCFVALVVVFQIFPKGRRCNLQTFEAVKWGADVPSTREQTVACVELIRVFTPPQVVSPRSSGAFFQSKVLRKQPETQQCHHAALLIAQCGDWATCGHCDAIPVTEPHMGHLGLMLYVWQRFSDFFLISTAFQSGLQSHEWQSCNALVCSYLNSSVH